jgi:hypothetical protein
MRRVCGLALVLALPLFGCGEEREIRRLEREHARLAAELERELSKDPVASEVRDDGGLIIVAIRSRYLGDLVREVAKRYFDRVALDLRPRLEVHHDEELKVNSPLGRVTAGRWAVDLTIQRVRGTLRGGAPEMSVSQPNRLDLVVPVVLENAEGQAQLHFGWDAASVFNLVCADFEVDEELRGRLLPQHYQVRGAFTFEARPDALIARPRFGGERFRLRVDLSRDSWDRVREALEAQDRPGKCGLALDPPTVMDKLLDLGHRGFDVRLPPGLLHDITLPATISGSAVVEGREIALVIEPRHFRVTPDYVWYSVEVESAVRRAAGEAMQAPRVSVR